MTAALLARLATTSRRRVVGVGALAVALAGIALAPGGLPATAARAALAAAAIGATAILVRKTGALAPRRPALAVVERVALGRDSGVAVVDLCGRRVLVGFGRGGVSLLGDAPPSASGRSAP